MICDDKLNNLIFDMEYNILKIYNLQAYDSYYFREKKAQFLKLNKHVLLLHKTIHTFEEI